MKATFKYRDKSGALKEGFMELNDYRIASDNNMRASAVVNARHHDADPAFGSAFEQGVRYLGIFPKGDTKYGVKPTTLKEMLDGTCTTKMSGFQLASGSIVSQQTPTNGMIPASSLVVNELILGFIEEELRADYGVEESAWNRMFALNQSISTALWTQPMVDVTAPGEQDARSQAQNALPTQMVGISASMTSKAIGVASIGLQISDEAMRDATLDLVSIIVREQTMGQRMRRLWRDLASVVTGNIDAGQTALTPVSFKTAYDATAAANTITHSGYLNMLWDPSRIYSMDFLLGTLDSYKAIEQRTGRPLMYDPNTTGNVGNEGSYGLNPGMPALINFTTANPSMLLVPTGVVPAKQLVMFDSRYALARVTNVSAQYSATEKQVLTRSNFFRYDLSEYVYRLREDAIVVVDYSNPG
ncbi:MAG: hypothetical protein EOM21_17850 [Gammaproteobacteria bacterium]|nr:hypothetical protein [Gammaproteobacteria bacterium]